MTLNVLLCSGNVKSLEVSFSVLNRPADSGDESVLYIPVSTVGAG